MSVEFQSSLNRPETLQSRLNYLIPRVCSGSLPIWPPDVFCLCAAVLQSSGAYSLVVSDNPPHGSIAARRKRAAEMLKIGKAWRKAVSTSRSIPAQLNKWWATVVQHRSAPLSEIGTCQACVLAILNLLAASDEASAGLGLFFGNTHVSDAYEREAERILFESARSKQGATLCKTIPASKGRVLPKMHTPQSGLTIRSLSHNIAYTYSPDICPEWLSAAVDTKHHGFNLLAIPWPMKVEPRQFRSTRSVGVSDVLSPHAYGLFTFEPSRGPSIELVRQLLEEARRTVGEVDGIIFPELAMSQSEFEHLAQEFVSEDRFLIGGVGTPAIAPHRCGTNEAFLQVGVRLSETGNMKATFAQKKHHRWKLTKPQILQYGLASTLHPGADWWEHITVGGRTLSFVTFRPWLTMSVLICEDLARPDPVGDVLRAVGPNLIIALLCDAPQIMSRWPGRYAGALADDPGSSVLTLTSIGASTLSKTLGGGPDRGRTVALWRDAKNGAKEIDLPEAASALLLTLSVEYHSERTADGRGADKLGGYPTLSGVHPLYLKEEAL